MLGTMQGQHILIFKYNHTCKMSYRTSLACHPNEGKAHQCIPVQSRCYYTGCACTKLETSTDLGFYWWCLHNDWLYSRYMHPVGRECHHPIFRIWCGAHQLDLVVKKAFNALCNDKFMNTLTGAIGHLHRQQNLIAEMDSTCSIYVSARWISMGKVLSGWKQSGRGFWNTFRLRTKLVDHPLTGGLPVLLSKP